MANTKELLTRIALKYDTYANWIDESKGANLVLLKGEIGICEIPTANADSNVAPTVLFKVGGARYTAADAAAGKGTEGELMKFKHLPWASAKAADVHSWAKVADPSNIEISYGTGDAKQTKTLANILNATLTNAADIAGIRDAITGGVHFIGTTTTELSDGSTVLPSITGKTYTTRTAGDIVIYNDQEFIWNDTAWEELGHTTRVGNLEALLEDLSEAARTSNQYVTHIAKENGKLVAKKARPQASEVQYTADDTVYTKIEALAAEIAKKAESGHEHPVYVNQNAFSHIQTSDGTVSADTTTDTVQFVGENITITGTDTEDDKITFTVAKAEAVDETGIVTLSSTIADTEAYAATPKAVKAAYDKADGAAGSVAAIESNYVKYIANSDTSKPGRFVIGKSGDEEYLIFNCGSATEVI